VTLRPLIGKLKPSCGKLASERLSKAPHPASPATGATADFLFLDCPADLNLPARGRPTVDFEKENWNQA
jgi:hypothetical protein